MMAIRGILSFTIRLFLALVIVNQAESGKLLVIPEEGSSWLSLRDLLENLSHRGHQIVVVVPEPNLFPVDLGFPVITYNLPFSKEFIEAQVKQVSKEAFEYKTVPQKIKTLYERFTNSANRLLTSCKLFLQNETLMNYLKEANFDVLLNDPAVPCGQIVAEYLSIPSINFMLGTSFGMDEKVSQSPSPLSYIPRFFTTYTDHMDFSQRVKNVQVRLLEYALCHMIYSPYAQVASEFLKRDVSSVDLFSRASIWLMQYDFVFQYPRPVMPNMVFIGGINCVDRKPLNQEFEKLVNSSGDHGFVVFSLGSMVSEIPMHKAMDLAEAFRGIPQTVIWRYTGPVPSNLGENTHLVKWLPQNDLLAHPKARAFITHAGSHGVYEGICNAVPMVLLPLFGDQMDNAKRIESRGAGITLNVLDLIPEELTNALTSVINKPSYKENIQRLSALHLDRPIHPLDLAVHWVEFVMRHKGAPHLRPAAHDLNWIQYHSIDVFAFLFAVVFTALFISIKCCAFTYRCCCRRKSSKGKSKSKKE